MTPGQAAQEPTELYARWWRIINPSSPDAVVRESWAECVPADREFWTELQAAIAARQTQDAPELAELKRRTASLYRLVDDILSHVEATSVRPSDAARVEAWRKRADDA